MTALGLAAWWDGKAASGLQAVVRAAARAQTGPHGSVLQPIEPHPAPRRVARAKPREKETRRDRGPLTLSRFSASRAVGRAAMRLIHASLLDDGAGEEQERRILVEGGAVFESERRLSLGRLRFNLFSRDGQHGAHG
jgi:hypothetical protein